MNKNKHTHFRKGFRFIPIVILMGCCILSVSSCKSKKVLQTATHQAILSPDEITSSFLARPEYHFVSGKAKINFQSDDYRMKGTIYLRTVKDSVIWIVAKKLSVEGGRVLITPDSIFYINRLDKTYQKMPLTDLEERFSVTANFSYLQNLLLGLTPEIDTTQHWELTKDSSSYNISTVIHDILHKFIVNDKSGLVTGGRFMDKFVADGEWIYDEYVYALDNQLVPKQRSLIINTNKDQELTMSINISEFEVDNPKPIRFNIPSHYTRQQ